MGFGGFSVGIGVVALAAWSVALAVSDIQVRRLPDPLTIPPALAALAACAYHPAWCWGLLWPALYLAVGDGVGGGDVKLAVALGTACAAAAGPPGVVFAVGLSGLISVAAALCARRRVVPHGPSMLCAAWGVILLAHTYSGV